MRVPSDLLKTNYLGMKEQILKILKEVRPDIDFEVEEKLIDDGHLDSFDIASIISELNDAFDIHIRVTELKPENFNSLAAILVLVERLKNSK
jgi:acyl carrier protein